MNELRARGAVQAIPLLQVLLDPGISLQKAATELRNRRDFNLALILSAVGVFADDGDEC